MEKKARKRTLRTAATLQEIEARLRQRSPDR
jgi:hypothetical protein